MRSSADAVNEIRIHPSPPRPKADPGATATPAPISADAQLAALSHQYYYEGFALHPIEATQAGVHAYDARIGDFSADAMQHEQLRDRIYLTRLALIDRRALSAEGAVDAQIFEDALRDDELVNGTLALWRHNPDYYSQEATAAIFSPDRLSCSSKSGSENNAG